MDSGFEIVSDSNVQIDKSAIESHPVEDTKNEPLVSDTCQEKFHGDAFEFSVTVEHNEVGNGQHEREITITKQQSECSSTFQPSVETEFKSEIAGGTVPESPNHTSSPNDGHSESIDKTVVIAPRDVTDETILVLKNPVSSSNDDQSESIDKSIVAASGEIQPEVTKQEIVADQTEPGQDIVPSHVEPAQSGSDEQTAAGADLAEEQQEHVPAQHGPSVALVIRAEPEQTLILRKEPITVDTPVTDPDRSNDEVTVVTRPDSRLSEFSSAPQKVRDASPVKQASVASADKIKAKKKPLMHFKFKTLRKQKTEPNKSEQKPNSNEVGTHSFKTNVKNVFGNIKRSMSQRHRPDQKPEHRTQPVARPPRPPPWATDAEHGRRGNAHSSLNELDQQSLPSTLGQSLPGSPERAKRRLIEQALPDFMTAMPTETSETMAVSRSRTEDSVNEDAVLANIASNIAHSAMDRNNDNSFHEEHIQPIVVGKPGSISNQASGSTSHSAYGHSPEGRAATTRSSGLPPKPPRPQSPPLLSPLDYQPYHEGSANLVQQRIEMMSSMQPGVHSSRSDEYTVTNSPYSIGRVQVTKPVMQYGIGPSTQHEMQQSIYSQDSLPTMRRTQTLRTDYANVIRNRVKSLRVDHSEPVGSGSMPQLKARPQRENYVCSDTIKLPNFRMKLKRRQTVPPKAVYATGVSSPENRNQPRIMSAYQSNELHRYAESELQPDYVVASQVGMVQSARGYDLNASVRNGQYNYKYGTQPRQLTSLRSIGGIPSVQQQTYLPESPKMGLLQLSKGILADQSVKSVTLPYISDSITRGCNNGLVPTTPDSHSALDRAIHSTQPFLSEWDQKAPTESANTPPSEEVTKSTMADFLKVCVRLRSVDLQGQFSPFHYPLPSFDVRQWRNITKFEGWTSLLSLTEADMNAEYVQLDPIRAKEQNLFYPERSVDTMITNWIDCHHTGPQSMNVYANSGGWTHSTTILHPVVLVSDLESLFQTKPYKNEQLTELFYTCFRLATLLSYEDCCTLVKSSNILPGNDLKNILIILSTSNCLVLFRSVPVDNGKVADVEKTVQNGDATAEEDTSGKENEVKGSTGEIGDKFVELLCPGQSSLAKAIDGQIEKLRQLTTNCINELGEIPNLIGSVAPPDWIAMLIARIVVSK